MNQNSLYALAVICTVSLIQTLCAAQGANPRQLLQLVQAQNAQQCLQKVICELSANPNAHGAEGIRFGRSLL